MDPATIVAGVSSVAGAILGKNRAARPSDTIRHTRSGIEGQASGAREFGEKFGFNPLALLGVSSPLQAQAVDNSAFGQGIANAGLAVAEGLNAASAQKVYQEELEAQNKELRKALDTSTLRPQVAGIFGTAQPEAVPVAPVSVQAAQARGMSYVPPDMRPPTPVESKWIKIWDERTKSMTWYPNPDLMDAGPTEMATGMGTIAAAESAQHGRPGGFDFMFNPPKRATGLSQEAPWVSFKKPGTGLGYTPPRIQVE